MTPTRAEVRAWLRQCVEQYGALIDARETDPDDVAGWKRDWACAYAALAALDDAERWAPRPGERYVRMTDELVAHLRAAPSEPVITQVRDMEDGTVMLVCERAEDRVDVLERISDGGWVSFRRHLDAWLLESSRYHGRGATIREAIDRVELRPQLQGEA